MRDVLCSADMFTAWGTLVCRRKWWVLAFSVLLLLGAVASLLRGGTLTTGSIEGIEADRTQALVEKSLALPGDASFTLVFWRASPIPSSYPRCWRSAWCRQTDTASWPWWNSRADS
jgi:hypothetical protein